MPHKNPLTPEFITSQRARLEALKAELQATDDDLLRETTDRQAIASAEAADLDDAAQALDRKEVRQSRRDVDLQRLAHVERALKKIDLGSYGLSDRSGKPIPMARLEATPEATLTVDEAAAAE